MDISYRGTPFSGWQIQKNARSVQEEIEKALATILQTKIGITGSGRTDTGVHAIQQIAHFDYTKIRGLSATRHRLNSLLHEAVSVNNLREVKDDAHARFDAIARIYKYFIHQNKNPFKQNQSYFFNLDLDLGLMNKGAQIIKAHQNFECFSKVHTEVNHFNCDIFDARWETEGAAYIFTIKANRFLRGMVRTIVGTLIDIGLHRTSLNQLEEILGSRNRSKAGRAVPAAGLFLVKVEYPSTIYLN